MNDPYAAELGLRRERGAEVLRDAPVLLGHGDGWLRGGHHAEDPFAPHGLRFCPAAAIDAAAGAGHPGTPAGGLPLQHGVPRGVDEIRRCV